MNDFRYKIGLSALWLLEVVAFIYYRTLAIEQNAHNASLLKPEELVGYLLAVLTLAVLSLILARHVNRDTNIIAGVVMGSVQLIMFIDGFEGYSSAKFNLITVAALIITVLIVSLAYRWPKSTE